LPSPRRQSHEQIISPEPALPCKEAALRVSVSDLVDLPGNTRELRRAVERDELTDRDSWGVADDALLGPIELDLHLDSVVEGILVRGEVYFEVQIACARCTEPLTQSVTESVAELFVDPERADPQDEWDEGYELLDSRTAIDLSTLLRDLVLLDLPVRAVHDTPCQPPAIDGVEVRTEDEDRAIREATPDPRWGALGDLDLPTSN
jgi:uncharacterized protein